MLPKDDRPGAVEWVQHGAAVRYLLKVFDRSFLRDLQCALPESLRYVQPDGGSDSTASRAGLDVSCPAEALNELDWWISGWLEQRGHQKVVVPPTEWMSSDHNRGLPHQLASWPMSETRKHRIVQYFVQSHGLWAYFSESFANDPLTIREGLALARTILNGPRNHWLEAEALQRETLAGLERTLGPGHSDTLFAARDLALTIKQLRGVQGPSGTEVEALLQRSASGLSKALGPHHADVQKVEWELTRVRLSVRGSDAAEAISTLEL